LKPKDASKDISEFAKAEITLVQNQNILYTLEENVIHHHSKHKDPGTLPNPHRFRPPTDNPRQHRRKEEESPHLHTGANKRKA
jgi:hypothetical protein